MKLLPKRFTAWRRRGKASVANDLAFLSPEERKQLGTAKGSRKTASKTAAKGASKSAAKGTRKTTAKGGSKTAAKGGRFSRSR